ncbi:MAG: hypothetical protein JHC33_08090 [Ignisphaera sp.]|nr:hypothetical protein [Ignisphaera sp.]
MAEAEQKQEQAKEQGKEKDKCVESLLDMIELGYTTVGLRVRAEKTTQFFTSVLKNLQNLPQIQQDISTYLHDVARQWSDAVIAFDTTTREFAISLSGVIDVCIKSGRTFEDIMTYIDALLDMILGVPTVLKHEKVEETKKEESKQ